MGKRYSWLFTFFDLIVGGSVVFFMGYLPSQLADDAGAGWLMITSFFGGTVLLCLFLGITRFILEENGRSLAAEFNLKTAIAIVLIAYSIVGIGYGILMTEQWYFYVMPVLAMSVGAFLIRRKLGIWVRK